MKIYYDENMPYAAELFARFGEVHSFAGRECNADTIADADVLLVRSITKVNAELLQYADNLKFVGTATIGTDHIDQAYLASRDIYFTSAPGCNAVSVAEYVLSAIKVLEQRYLFSLQGKTVGIVGGGNTGSALANKLDALGVEYLLCDPPLALAGDSRDLVAYQQLLTQSDIISFHVPLVIEGDYPTKHLFGQQQLDMIKADAIVINACRGEVIDNQMLLAAKKAGNHNPLVLDVWEGEPNVLAELIPFVDIATAHIAGYSFEGKAKGSLMLYQALCEHLAQTPSLSLADILPKAQISELSLEAGEYTELIDEITLNRVIHLVYDVRRDDGIFRHHIGGNGFDWIRKNYPVRREFSALTVNSQTSTTLSTLSNLGFTIGE